MCIASYITHALQFTIIHCSRERNHISDIGHSREVHNQSLETESKPGMAGGAVFSKIQIELIALLVQSQLTDS